MRTKAVLIAIGILLSSDALAELWQPIRTFVSQYDPVFGACECLDTTDYAAIISDPAQPESLRVLANEAQALRPCVFDSDPVDVEQMAEKGFWTYTRIVRIPRGELVLSGWDLPAGFWLIKQRAREQDGLWSCWGPAQSNVSIQMGVPK